MRRADAAVVMTRLRREDEAGRGAHVRGEGIAAKCRPVRPVAAAATEGEGDSGNAGQSSPPPVHSMPRLTLSLQLQTSVLTYRFLASRPHG